MSEHPFDSLARTLAGGASRRGVLRAIGGAVLGSLVAAPAQAVLAAGNSDCAHFCASVFGADTAAASKCTSDAAHGKGLCVTCGPASRGGGVAPSAICCTRTSSGACSGSSPATCCSSGQICQHSTCITPCAAIGGTCGGNATCCAGLACCNGTCLNPNTYATDANNCGSCGHKCPAGASCVSGVCQQQVGGLCDATTACISTTGGVHRSPCCNGTCTDTVDDNNNCGACGHSCGSCSTCQNGACVSTCTSEQVCQSGQCCLPAGATFPFNCSGTCCDPAVCCSGLGSNTGFVCTCL